MLKPQLYTLYAETFKLDGGACFGVVPKQLWGKAMLPDQFNRIQLFTRLLLVVTYDRCVLIDTGVGNKEDEKFSSIIQLEQTSQLIESLNAIGFTRFDITDVVLTHLHFDHVGGCSFIEDNSLYLTFPNATHWCSQTQWEWATKLHSSRERASYLPHNLSPIEQSELLKFTDQFSHPNIVLKEFHGHTKGQVIPFIQYENTTLVYTADFIPSLAHIQIPYVAAYDIDPLISMQEKEQFLEEAVKNNYILFFQHDILNECCTVKQTIKGIRPNSVLSLEFVY